MTDPRNGEDLGEDSVVQAPEEGAPPSVRPDPVDERDRTYPPDVSVGPGQVEPVERGRIRQVFDGDADALETPRRGDGNGPPHSTISEKVKDAFACADYRLLADTSWRQRGQECTGFALASIADYHLRSDFGPDDWAAASDSERRDRTVSRRMLYEMAQRYDEADFVEGSTLRGALKGWARAGVAAEQVWPYVPGDEHGDEHGSLSMPRALDAAARPGPTYLRIEVDDRIAMCDAVSRGFPLFASARTHVGWFDLYLPGRNTIEREESEPLSGAHAFVIYGYDERGWLIHNSWGPEWGDSGFAVLPYDDFAVTAQDVWFVFPPRRIEFVDVRDPSMFDTEPVPSAAPSPYTEVDDMWLHRVSIGDDGGLSKSGRYGMNSDELGTLLYLFRQRTQDWDRRRLAIFADPGLWNPDDTLDALRPFRDQLMAQEIYPLFLVWDSPWFDGFRGWLHGEAASDPNGPGMAADSPDAGPNQALVTELGEMWAVLSKFLVAQSAAPRIWDQLHASAVSAFVPGTGAARILADRLAYNLTRASFDVHLVGMGVGDFLLSELAMSISTPIRTCQLWSPITTMDRFAATYGSKLDSTALGHLHVVTLDSAAERADRTGPVPGSLLQVASDVLEVADIDLETAVEERGDGLTWTPESRSLLGLQSTINDDPQITDLRADGVVSHTSIETGTHTGMLTDPSVWKATIESIASAVVPEIASDSPDSTTRPDAAARMVDPLDWVIARTSR